MLRLTPPIFVIHGPAKCWRCGKAAKAAAVAAFTVAERDRPQDDYEDLGEPDEPILATNIRALPGALLDRIRVIQPNYELRDSRAGGRYYANFCPHCDSIFGDFFLFAEPGGTFFPTEQDEWAPIQIALVPGAEVFEIDGSWGMGTGQQLFAHGTPTPEAAAEFARSGFRGRHK